MDTRTENCCPDTDDGCALRDSGFKIGRHPHRKSIQFEPIAAQAFLQATQFGKTGTLQGDVSGSFRDSHEPPQPQAGQAHNLACKCWNVCRIDPPFVLLTADVNLDANLKRIPVHTAGPRQPFRNLESVYRMHPIEIEGDISSLVALNGTDEVPFNIPARFLRYEFRDFFHAFLHITLAEGTLSGVCCGANRAGRERLAHSKQFDVIGIASGSSRSRGNSQLHALQVGENCCHNGPTNLPESIAP